MTNKQLIKYAHIFALVALLALGLLAVAGNAGNLRSQNSNQNQNQNQNQNGNTNTGNANTSQNQNANTGNDNMRGNRNSGDAAGGRTAMRNLSSQDRNFLMDAAMGGLMEVELGRLATERGASDAVKQFGQRMVDDHTAANTELMSIASSKGITLPTTLDRKHQQHVTKLSGLSGAEFDRAYSRMMVTDHNKDVKTFERESTRGADPDLRAFATKTLPTLQEHLQMARALPGNEGGNMNSAGGRNTNRGANMNSNRNNNGNTNRNNNGNNNGNSNQP